MDFKGILKYLPIISFFKYEQEYEQSKGKYKSPIKRLERLVRHFTYGLLPFYFLTLSFNFGTANPLRWKEILEQRAGERQEYNQLYHEATRCVDQDGSDGLNLNELGELYSRAGVDVNFYSATGELNLPKLTRENLEKVVKGCKPGTN